MEELQSRINMVNGALSELRVSSLTLDGLEEEKKGSQLFVPIGGGWAVANRLTDRYSGPLETKA